MLMVNKRIFTFSVITFVVGFMLAIQFQTTKKPEVRDTRDIWQVHEDLNKERKYQSELVKKIREVEDKISIYKSRSRELEIEGLQKSLYALKKKAGLTEVKGPGVIVMVEPILNESMLGQPYMTVSPELLSRLINELNMYQVIAIAIDDQRIVSTSSIRDVNGRTQVNGRKLMPLPLTIKVVTKDIPTAEKLNKRMHVSQSVEEFIIEGLSLTTQGINEVVIPPYHDEQRVQFMKSVDEEKGGS
jgi:uncharacterized protein YlxW (UPF0749 family)